MDKPHGTIICSRCQSIQCGLLDLVCDKCDLPLWEGKVLEYGLAKLADTSQQGPSSRPDDAEANAADLRARKYFGRYWKALAK